MRGKRCGQPGASNVERPFVPASRPTSNCETQNDDHDHTTAMSLTESPSPEHTDLDRYDAQRLVEVMIADQARAATAVAAAAADIARAVEAAHPRIEAGGRLVYVGAGTSGRLGLQDSVELYPTFSWPHERVVALLAGGHSAVFQAIEGAEDRREQGAHDVVAAGVTGNDVVIAIAASGTTPFVLGAIRLAHLRGGLTGFLTCAPTARAEHCDHRIVLDTGPEVLTGSTRLKAGSATKLALNIVTTVTFARLGKVYGNLMVDVAATNDKLVDRAIRIVRHFEPSLDREAAHAVLDAAGRNLKVAIVMCRRGVTRDEAIAALRAADGSLRGVIG